MNIFEIKTTIIFGQNSLDYIKKLNGKKIFIVTDPYMVQSNTISMVTDNLNGQDFEIFSDIVPDPPIELVVKGVERVIFYKPDIIIALGGGSAIDAAKAIMSFSKTIGKLSEMQFIAIPTTSGTGSEVTEFSVITDTEKGVKYPLISEDLLPDISILETEFVKSVPPSIVADTGMDVLTHAVEAYVSTNATDFSDAFAEKAVELVFMYLKRSFKSKNDMEAKEKMHNASCIAGIAFNLASLGISHAIAHNIGGKLHISHGRTNSMLLPHVIEYNASIDGFNPDSYTKAALKYANLSKIIGLQGGTTRILVKNFINEIIKLQKEIKIPMTLNECKVSNKEFEKYKNDIAEGALNDICMVTNPRKATQNDVLEIIKKIVK